jgi:hypothetical protein
MEGRCHGGIIEQIIGGAEGWQAVFAIDDGVEWEPVVCWALVGCRDAQHVHPIVTMGGEAADATLAGNYLGIVPPGTAPAVLLAT